MIIEDDTPAPVDLPILDREFKANPFKLYDMLRQPGRSIVPIRLPTGVRAWLVTSYPAARQLLKDPRLSKDSLNSGEDPDLSDPDSATGASHAVFQHLLMKDPPTHTRLRSLLVRVFDSQRIRDFKPRISQICSDLLDDIAPLGKTDLIASFAIPMPLRTICGIVGIPGPDVDRVRSWSSALLQADLENPDLTDEIAQEIFDYLLDLAEAKRCLDDDSVYCGLVKTMDEGRLSREELAAMGFVLMFAGYETTANLIGNGVYTLLTHRPSWSALCADPDLASAAVEELLRLQSPLEVATQRFATSDIEIEGVRIQPGDMVFIGLAAANRDPRQFQCPNDLSFNRRPSTSHLAFGSGIHYCPGAELARLQGEIAFGTLARRFPDMELDLDPSELEWTPGLIMRGLQSLPVRF